MIRESSTRGRSKRWETCESRGDSKRFPIVNRPSREGSPKEGRFAATFRRLFTGRSPDLQPGALGFTFPFEQSGAAAGTMLLTVAGQLPIRTAFPILSFLHSCKACTRNSAQQEGTPVCCKDRRRNFQAQQKISPCSTVWFGLYCVHPFEGFPISK